MNKRIQAGDLSAHSSFLKRIVHVPEYQIETKIPILLLQLFPLGKQLLKGQIVE
jgi:hypothetical protein